VVLLAAVHALSRTDVAGLRLNDIGVPARTLTVRGRCRPLHTRAHDQLVAWLRQRRRRWPATPTPTC
jgi:hypothetical protein